MDYKKITITKLSLIPINHNLLYEIAILFAKTGFYEPSIKIKKPEEDPFEIIIEKYILPDIENFNIIFYDNELIGFYAAHLITNMIPRELNTIPSTKDINWANHGTAIYNFYEVYFKNNEFIIDNLAIKDQFQNESICSGVLVPTLLEQAKSLKATSIVAAVFKYQSNNAYKLCLTNGAKPIANLKFKLDKVIISPNYVVDGRIEELVLLRLNLTQESRQRISVNTVQDNENNSN